MADEVILWPSPSFEMRVSLSMSGVSGARMGIQKACLLGSFQAFSTIIFQRIHHHFPHPAPVALRSLAL